VTRFVAKNNIFATPMHVIAVQIDIDTASLTIYDTIQFLTLKTRRVFAIMLYKKS